MKKAMFIINFSMSCLFVVMFLSLLASTLSATYDGELVPRELQDYMYGIFAINIFTICNSIALFK